MRTREVRRAGCTLEIEYREPIFSTKSTSPVLVGLPPRYWLDGEEVDQEQARAFMAAASYPEDRSLGSA